MEHLSGRLTHYGTHLNSGRRPWGSGDNENSRPFRRETKTIKDYYRIQKYKQQGLSEKEIAEKMGMSVANLRGAISRGKDQDMYEKGFAVSQYMKQHPDQSLTWIADQLGLDRTMVNRLAKQNIENSKYKQRQDIVDALIKDVEAHEMVDVGKGTERILNVSKERLKSIYKDVEEQGYEIVTFKSKDMNTGNMIDNMVLVKKGTSVDYVKEHKTSIHPLGLVDRDGEVATIGRPKNIPRSKVKIEYESDMDGVMEIGYGDKNFNLGASRYAQVRIGVEGPGNGLYLKGMAVMTKDLPPGEVRFHTNKKKGTDFDDVLKKQYDDPDNPFKAAIKNQNAARTINMLSEEGDWDGWNGKFSSQFLSKQSHALMKDSVNKSFKRYEQEYDDILAIKNPYLRKAALEEYAQSMDSRGKDLKLVGIKGTKAHVILPDSSLKESEVYAPNFPNGTKLALVRYPHAGTFEIGEVVVNNNRKSKMIKNIEGAKDAIVLHPKVAEKMSGADFDGDTVIAIPNNKGQVKISPTLKDLKNFDPKEYHNKNINVTNDQKQKAMGKISNLITNMQIRTDAKGNRVATDEEIARAVKHSMVVIDSEKHHLDMKASAKKNAIAALTKKYGTPNTLIGNAKKIPTDQQYKDYKTALTGKLKMRDGSLFDAKKTGVEEAAKVMAKKGQTKESLGEKKYNKLVEEQTNNAIAKKLNLDKQSMSAIASRGSDVKNWSTGTETEKIYEGYINGTRKMSAAAQKQAAKISYTQNKGAAKKYASEINSINKKLGELAKNLPLERAAQRKAGAEISREWEKAKESGENIDYNKTKTKALNNARKNIGANRVMHTTPPSHH